MENTAHGTEEKEDRSFAIFPLWKILSHDFRDDRKWMTENGKKPLIGPQEAVAIGLGAMALLRIRRRRRREAEERAAAERAKQQPKEGGQAEG